MERDYAEGVRSDVIFFTGIEVEHTPQRGAHTLFVVGVQDAAKIHELASNKVCRHIYLGANQSFKVEGYGDAAGWKAWDDLCCELLDLGYWVTLDFDVTHWLGACEMRAMSHAQFIPQVSVKLPYITIANYNTMIKLDDTDFRASNPGVWCHSLHDLMDRDRFTGWDQYEGDKSL